MKQQNDILNPEWSGVRTLYDVADLSDHNKYFFVIHTKEQHK